MWSVSWRVLVDGRDASSAMRPFLTSIEISDRDGTVSDTCRLTFDDGEGRALLPREKARLSVEMDGAPIFEGTVDSVRSRGARSGGLTLDVGAKGFDTNGRAGEGQLWHLDDATLGEALGRAAGRAGFTLSVDPSFASIARDYWSPDGGSFLDFGQRIARELGATFKLRGNRAVLAKRGSGTAASGAALPVLRAARPGNVLSWDIEPFRGGRSFRRTRVRFLDRETGRWRTEEVAIEGGVRGEATNAVRTTAADAGQARGIAEGRGSEAEREAGGGTLELTFEPEAQAEGAVLLTGVRPGIDGLYRAVGVTHRASRSGGASTSLDLKQPHGAAGRDERAAT